jgi:citrate lyase subunit gamma (acyl carrier protein)
MHFAANSCNEPGNLTRKKGDTMTSAQCRIRRQAQAGFNDKSDILVRIGPADPGSGIQLEMTSKVMSMFGKQIKTSVLEVLESYDLTDAMVLIQDQGALDYAIRARVQTAVERAIREEE